MNLVQNKQPSVTVSFYTFYLKLRQMVRGGGGLWYFYVECVDLAQLLKNILRQDYHT